MRPENLEQNIYARNVKANNKEMSELIFNIYGTMLFRSKRQLSLTISGSYHISDNQQSSKRKITEFCRVKNLTIFRLIFCATLSNAIIVSYNSEFKNLSMNGVVDSITSLFRENKRIIRYVFYSIFENITDNILIVPYRSAK